jgi:hypothetical protein
MLMASQIQELATSLEIPFLIHFTRIENVPSILEHGIIPIGQAGTKGLAPRINDTMRLDGQTSATCVSIAFPNHRMFFKYRNEDKDQDWAVLALNPSVLWQKRCAFCRHNAADGRSTSIPISDRMTVDALAGMYAEVENHRSRADQKLKSYDPTDDQAEVLVFDVIEPPLIVGAAFNNKSVLNSHKHLLGGKQVVYSTKIFSSRSYNREY